MVSVTAEEVAEAGRWRGAAEGTQEEAEEAEMLAAEDEAEAEVVGGKQEAVAFAVGLGRGGKRVDRGCS